MQVIVLYVGRCFGAGIFRFVCLETYLSAHVVDQAFQAGLHAEAMLAWQQLGVPVAVQANGAGQQLLELLHSLYLQGETDYLDLRFRFASETQKARAPNERFRAETVADFRGHSLFKTLLKK